MADSPKIPPKMWGSEDSDRACAMWQLYFANLYGDEHGPPGARQRVLHLIAKDLARPIENVVNHFDRHGPTFGSYAIRRSRASADALAERAARRRAEAQMNLTQSIFGDPPPGFSELDRKQRSAQA